jgi:hypothetical protein
MWANCLYNMGFSTSHNAVGSTACYRDSFTRLLMAALPIVLQPSTTVIISGMSQAVELLTSGTLGSNPYQGTDSSDWWLSRLPSVSPNQIPAQFFKLDHTCFLRNFAQLVTYPRLWMLFTGHLTEKSCWASNTNEYQKQKNNVSGE